MIGLVYVGWIEHSPFVKRYTDIMDAENIEYEVINWNRYSDKSIHNGNIYTYGEPVDHFVNIVSKIKPMLNFRKYACGIIKKKNYDKIVILTTQTAVLFPDLIEKYRNRYIFDYRDASYEYILPYRKYVTHIVNNSIITCISSPGFREYVKGKRPIITAHNLKRSSYENRNLRCSHNLSGAKITVGFVGVLREYEYFCGLIDMFGRDERFDFKVYGGGDDIDRFREYAKKYSNVTFFGRYNESEKDDIIETFDIMCYNYPYTFVNYPAVANKFYDGLIHKKPMYANSETFSGKMIRENGLGISISENDEQATEKIYEYYRSIDADLFNERCEKMLAEIIREDDLFNEKVREALIK